MPKIAFIKIHPAIGIARVGNHPDAFFVGPEKPFDFTPPAGGYKAEERGVLKVKRQAARFRLYAYDAKGHVLGEITKDTAQITWRVRLANKKAAWEEFEGPQRNPGRWRNRHLALSRRKELVINPGERTIDANQQGAVAFDTGSFLSFNPNTRTEIKLQDIYLGELRTDDAGRLLVLGGRGTSDSPSKTPIEHYANNDGWYDDISDGPVDATVTVVHEGETVTPPVRGAWVVCAPPDFAPPVLPIVSLYDTLYDRAVRQGVADPPASPTFANDVYPLLEAAFNVKQVYADPLMGKQFHGFVLSANMPKKQREAIFDRIRVPAALRNAKTRPGTPQGNMPRLRDGGDSYSLNGLQDEGFTVTPTQYLVLEKWSKGSLSKKGGIRPTALVDITPEGVDRAALAKCIGGAFFPESRLDGFSNPRRHCRWMEPTFFASTGHSSCLETFSKLAT